MALIGEAEQPPKERDIGDIRRERDRAVQRYDQLLARFGLTGDGRTNGGGSSRARQTNKFAELAR